MKLCFTHISKYVLSNVKSVKKNETLTPNSNDKSTIIY